MTIRTLISLDYELFFGEKTGSVDRCLIEPTQKTANVLNKHNAKLVLFVDASYLVRIKQLSAQYPDLGHSFDQIAQQLSTLSQQGHDIQLHIHPHWDLCHYDGSNWHIDTSKYRLHDYNNEEINAIVRACCTVLTDITDNPPIAFRAGGWCLQPFEKISDALYDNGIWIDSTVFENGTSDDPTRWFDFTHPPEKPHWVFNNDPMIEDPRGRFLEIPISSFKLSPLFFWKMAFIKKFSKREHLSFGDGYAMTANPGYYLHRLTRFSYSPVSIDGSKAGTLAPAFTAFKRRYPTGIFNIMGHPKSLSEYSLKKLDQFFTTNKDIMSITFRDLEEKNPRRNTAPLS